MDSTATDAWTIGRLLQWTTGYLRDHHSDSPRLDAELLLAEAVGYQRIELYTSFSEIPPEGQRGRFRELVRRRAAGTPVAYLLGRREFYSLEFRVTSDVLIPRPETEFLVVAALDRLRERGEPAQATIADVGTGSGIVAVSLAKHAPGATFTAIDICPKAIDVAKANARSHGVDDRIRFAVGDLLTPLDETPRLDLVLSNPPYVSTAEMADLSPEVAGFEPHLALEAGPQGTEIIQRLIPQAATRLRPGGFLLIEISPMIESKVHALIDSDGVFDLLPTIKDLAGLPRIVGARRR